MQKLLEILDKHVDQEALAKDLMKMYLMDKLKEWAADTEVPFDLDEKAVEMIEVWLEGEQ